jgi:hypothetical protein
MEKFFVYGNKIILRFLLVLVFIVIIRTNEDEKIEIFFCLQMTTKVTFVNKYNENQTFKVSLFGPNKNRVKISNVLAIFKATIAIMSNDNMMEADDLGLNMDSFDSGSKHVIILIPALDLGNFLLKTFINLSFLFLVQNLSLNIKFT